MIIDLTIREIADLAEYSGLEIDKTKMPCDDDLETVVCIAKCHPDGLENDDGVVEHYDLVMYFEDCPEEGVIPLGNPKIAGMSTRHRKHAKSQKTALAQC